MSEDEIIKKHNQVIYWWCVFICVLLAGLDVVLAFTIKIMLDAGYKFFAVVYVILLVICLLLTIFAPAINYNLNKRV
jgi:hypothetical protein